MESTPTIPAEHYNCIPAIEEQNLKAEPAKLQALLGIYLGPPSPTLKEAQEVIANRVIQKDH
jgi:hypothetical protein